ncbi:MAG: hypothetical protein ACOYNL_00820 [Rickettsiales bacterium]
MYDEIMRTCLSHRHFNASWNRDYPKNECCGTLGKVMDSIAYIISAETEFFLFAINANEKTYLSE